MRENFEQEPTAEIAREAYKTGIEAAVKASELVLRYWPNPANPHFDKDLMLEIFEKTEGVGNYATIADQASEQLIIDTIQANSRLAGQRIIGEELDPIDTDSEWQWIIDPIDGTPPFKNGLPEFGISIGVLKGKDPVAGFLAMPAQGQIIASLKGEGARLLSLDGKVLSELSELPPVALNHSLIAYDLGYAGRGDQLANIVAKLADVVGYPVSYGSSSTGNFRVATGNVGAYFCKTPTKFDIAASSAIITELGGVVTDMSGNPIDWQAPERSYLAARDPNIHRQVLEIINS